MDDPLLPAKRKRDQLDAPNGVRDEEGARAARASCGDQPGVSGVASSEAVTVALLSGHDDPCTNEQYTMWKERLFTDVWLQAGHPGQPEGARVPGTRLLLASLSPYLKKLLVGSQQLRGLDGDTIFVDVPGGEHALALVVEALYSRRLRMSVGAGPYCVLDVLRVANFLDVRCVLDVALAFLQANLSTSNALRVASLGEAHGLADVRAAAVEFVVNNFEAMVGSGGDCAGSSSAMVDTGFVAIDKALLVELLQSDRLRVNGEMTVFRALMAWLDANDDLMAPPLTTEQPGQGITATGQSLPLDDDAPHDGHDAAGCNSAPQPGRPCPHHLLSLIRFQYIPQEFLFGEVAPHPRLQTLGAKDMLLSTLREFNVSNTLAAVPPAAPPSPATAATADPLPPSAEPGMLLSIKAYSPRQYDKVDSRTVPMGTQLRVRDCEELVRGLCDTLPVDQPIKFVMRMKQTIGQQGRLMQKSRRGSLKLHFDLPELPDERRDFWYPAEALSYV